MDGVICAIFFILITAVTEIEMEKRILLILRREIS